MAEWQQVKEIVGDALELAPENRPLFLDEVCADDEPLRREVESLLDSSANVSVFMEQAAIGKVAEMFDSAKNEVQISGRFNHYEILKQIGAGGMGEVYLAEDTKLDRKVAIKILNEKFAVHESNLQRFVREAKAASSLNHPNILVIYEIGEAENVQYIVSEFVEGATLRELIELATLELPAVLDISIQIAGALAAAHTAHIVHRDIKPENIIVRPDGYVKILDFGLAKLVEQQKSFINPEGETTKQSETAQGVIMGTVNYMSPEQAKGERINERTDIFSLGAVIYEMIAGRTPFAGNTMSETFANLINQNPPPLVRFVADTPNELQRIVAKTLKKDKDERYQTMKGFLSDLKELKENLAFDSKSKLSAESNNAATKIFQPLTGEANKLTNDVQIIGVRQTLRKRIAGQWRGLLALGLFLALLSAALIYYFDFRKTSIAEIKSVMVLPLKNIGGDASDEYLSDGITDELITKLTKLKTVRVVSPSVAMRYKNSPKDAAEIGREMNVEAVIEGTIRKVGTRFRLSIHLVNAQNGFEIWSDDDFESELNNLLDAEGQIAESVASRLKGQLTPQERGLVAGSSTTNADAYELFLRGKQQYRKGESQLARDLFDRAIQLDPNFADAYAWRGRVIYQQFHNGHGDHAILNAALADANRALQIDPNIISARVTLINIYHSTGQYEEGLKQGKRLLEINPDDLDAMEGAALAYFRAGMIDKAIPLYQRAIAADPTDAEISEQIARCYMEMGEFQKGIDILLPMLAQGKNVWWIAMDNYIGLKQFDKAIEMGKLDTSKDPDNPNGWVDYGEALKEAGKAEQARAVWTEGAKLEEAKLATFENVRTHINLGFLYAHLGKREKALMNVNRALALEPDDPWTLFFAGVVHAILNNRPKAIDYIKQSIAHGWLGIHFINQTATDGASGFANLRGDPEFQTVRADLQKKVDELAKQY